MEAKSKKENSQEAPSPARSRVHVPGIVRILLFILIFWILLTVAGRIFQTVYGRGTGQGVNGTAGFYDVPEDTIQTVVLGTSVAGSGINTMQLYEDCGICAYNLSVSWQPMLASYYWLEEAYRLHSDSLTAVVLDLSALQHTSESEKYYKASIDCLAFSAVKLEAVSAYSDGINEIITNLFPLFYFHDRWCGDLGKSDLTGSKYKAENVMGYEFFSDSYFDNEDWEDMYVLTGVLDEDAQPTQFGTEALDYFDRIVSFCEEHDLELVLIKTPHQIWDSSDHNAAQALADSYGLTFLDFNFGSLLEEIDFNMATDTVDGTHANYYGAQKLTSYLEEYLTARIAFEEDASDSAYMEKMLQTYHSRVSDVMALKEETDPVAYLQEAMALAENEVYLTVRNTMTAELTQSQREGFSALGLSVLSSQTDGSSYLGVIQNGEVIYEDTIVFDKAAYKEADSEGTEWTYETLTYSFIASNGALVKLSSGGRRLGNLASCRIEGKDRADGSRGLNIVVYNTDLGIVTDSAVFDLASSSERENSHLEEACEEAEALGTDFDALSDVLQDLIRYNELTDSLREEALSEVSSDGDADDASGSSDAEDTTDSDAGEDASDNSAAEDTTDSDAGEDASDNSTAEDTSDASGEGGTE